MACLEDIFDDLVVGHALQMAHFCETPLDQMEEGQATVMSAQASDGRIGEYHHDDYDYECGRRSEFVLLNEQAELPGDRLTCFQATTMPVVNLQRIVPAAVMGTDWRGAQEDNHDAMDPACYVFQPTN